MGGRILDRMNRIYRMETQQDFSYSPHEELGRSSDKGIEIRSLLSPALSSISIWRRGSKT
jgi:hypothetical protein